MIAYKLFKLRKDGTIGPLFINPRQVVPVGEWLEAEDHPTKGFAYRPGWHCCLRKEAPHLTRPRKSGPKRVWAKVEVEDYKLVQRPDDQGGTWCLSRRLRVVEVEFSNPI